MTKLQAFYLLKCYDFKFMSLDFFDYAFDYDKVNVNGSCIQNKCHCFYLRNRSRLRPEVKNEQTIKLHKRKRPRFVDE